MSAAETVDVTFPVRLRLRPDVALSRTALDELARHVAVVVEDACLSERGKRTGRPLARLTPEDDLNGTFGLTVDPPVVALRDLLLWTHWPADAS